MDNELKTICPIIFNYFWKFANIVNMCIMQKNQIVSNFTLTSSSALQCIACKSMWDSIHKRGQHLGCSLILKVVPTSLNMEMQYIYIIPNYIPNYIYIIPV